MYQRLHRWLSDSWLRWHSDHPRRAAAVGWVQCQLVNIEALICGRGELTFEKAIPMTCEDCGGPVTNTAPEVVAMQHGLQVCASCLQSYEDEADAYDAMMEEAGVRCEFDPPSGRFVQRQIEGRCR